MVLRHLSRVDVMTDIENEAIFLICRVVLSKGSIGLAKAEGPREYHGG